METRARYAIIGAFTLVVIVLAFGFVYWLKRLDETGIRSTVYFEFEGTVGGLAPGSAVYFAGIKVGNVSSLAFDPADPNIVLVTADVRVDTPIKVDSRAEVGSNLLTGVAYIEMSGGTAAAQSVFEAQPPKIIGSKSALSDVIGAASSAIVKVEGIVSRVDEFIAKNEDAITKTAQNVERFTGALASNTDGIQGFLDNVSDMSDTVAQLSDRLVAVVDKANNIISAVDPERVSSVVENADRLVAAVADSTADIKEITGKVKGVADDIARFSEGLNKTLADVQGVVDGIDREKIASAVDNISAFTDKLKTASPDIDSLVADAKATVASAKEVAANASVFTENLNARKDDLNKIVANAKDLSERLKGTSEKLDAVLGKANDFLGGSGEEGKNFFQEATAAARSIRQITAKLDAQAGTIVGGIAQFSDRGLKDINALVQELRASVARIDRAIGEFSRNPGGAVFGGNSGVREYNRR
ncbi:MAG: MCE family protein [Bauldia sp.]|uniref:MlaD family protein n=1 Tax=Bauldia sp. TaxID=2575872 RepID=UPI001D4356FA|nr:MCE family protein [Bauldia sp.]MCB1487700.1 MCE family protein [Bauldia sp.]MCB1498144.1 MCE family protein [Bauldia sp.]